MGFPSPTADQSASELKRQIEAEREGAPFLVHRDPGGEQHITSLKDRKRLTVGRGEGVDLGIEDEAVSRLHAELERVGDAWVLSDDGLSTNGSQVNGERLLGRRRLADRDLIRFGGTGVLFRDAAVTTVEVAPTVADSSEGQAPPPLGATQRKILIALCRPLEGGGGPDATPATNAAIAEELSLSINAVKSHLRVLFEKFRVDDLPQNQKRVALAGRALRSGTVNPAELAD